MEIKNMTGSITPCHVHIFILSIESSYMMPDKAVLLLLLCGSCSGLCSLIIL